jgi:DNA polymerase-3 subunit delta'
VSFADFKGQESAVSFLKSSLKNNRLSHAYIFCGPRGVGKFSTAMNFAKALTCQAAVSGKPCDPSTGLGSHPEVLEGCDKCPSCKKIDNFAHPDVFVLKPQIESGAIKIDDIRRLIKDIYLKPFEAKKKVYIIDEVQNMKHEAANALLKTLEEPPTDSVLILVTDSLKSLFHTIISRSQIVRFYPLKPNEIKQILKEEHSLDENKAHVLSCLSCGRLGQALLYKDEDIFQKREMLISSVSKKSFLEFAFDNVPREKLKLYLDILLSWFRDIFNAKAGADHLLLINIDKIGLISKEAKRLSFDYLEDVINNIVSTMGYLDQNVNQKLAMSVLALKIVQCSAYSVQR